MAREKATGATTLRNWGDVDNALKQVGSLTREIAKKELAASEKIEAAKAKLKMDTAEPIAKKTALLHDMEMFAQLNKDALVEEAGKKSIDLNHGKIGFRKSTKIVTTNVKKIIELLKGDKRGKQYIRVTEAVNKEALRDVADDELMNWGIRREVTDEFWCEPAETTARGGPGNAA